jgi:hypothetical protein
MIGPVRLRLHLVVYLQLTKLAVGELLKGLLPSRAVNFGVRTIAFRSPLVPLD